MDRETVERALEADPEDRIECPICGDRIRAFQLTLEHAHPREQLEAIHELLERSEERRGSGFEVRVERDQSASGDSLDERPGDRARELIVRYVPDAEVAETRENVGGSESGEGGGPTPERRVLSIDDEEGFERLAEAVLGVADAFLGADPPSDGE